MTNTSNNESQAAEQAAPPAASEEAASGDASHEDEPTEGGAGSGVPEAEALRADLEEVKQERDMINDRLLRTAAELQNVRRRAAEEQQRRAVQAKASALRPMLEVLDDLQRALDAAQDSGDGAEAEAAFQSLRSGVQMVSEKFESTLLGLGVEPIEAEGQAFDEAKHEAMMQQPAPQDVAPGTVLAEIRRGYRMEAGGEERILRHSRVVVAAAPAEEEQPVTDEDARAAESASE